MNIEFNYEKFDKLNNLSQDIFDYNYLDVAREIYSSLNILLTKEKERLDPNLFRKFRRLQARYGFICLPSLTESELMAILRDYSSEAFRINGYDLWEQLKKYLITVILYEDRDRIKNDIKNILIKSETRITATSLTIDKKEVGGTIGNWIHDYHSYLGAGLVDQLEFEQYFVNSLNIKKLNSVEKERVKSILKLYEKLKISSKTPEGYEEKVLMKINGELKVWKDGFLEDIDPTVVKVVKGLKTLGFFKEKNETEDLVAGQPDKKISVDRLSNDLAELKELAASFPAGSLERKAVEEEMEKMEQEK